MSDVVEVSGAEYEEDPDKEIVVYLKQNLKKKDNTKKPKGTTKACGAKDKGKRKRKTSEVDPKEYEQGPGPQVHVDETSVNKQTMDNQSTHTPI